MVRNRLDPVKEGKQIVSSSGRRQFLKGAGIGSAVLLGATGTASAEDTNKRGDKNDHYMSMGSAKRSDGIEIMIGWEWDPDDFGDTGQRDADGVNDGVGIKYDTRRWEMEILNYHTDDHCEWDGWHTPSGDYHGVSWEYDHEGDYFDDGLKYRQCSTLLSKKDGHDKYPVQSEYHHTWNDTSIKGLGLGSYSFYVRWENSGEEWTKKYPYNDVR
jgi:hypothetical protein